jgi:uncharacterized alpha-E superfamily protein
MLSRVADSIYWMSRYVERVENVARFVDVTFNLMLDLPDGSAEQWQPLVSTTGDQTWFAQRYGEATRDSVVRYLVFDPEYPNSIISCLEKARESARCIRETISPEMWEHLNHFYYMVLDGSINEDLLESPQELLSEVKKAGHLFQGVTDGTMPHGEAWHFVQLGKLLERADKTSRILDVKYYILLPNVEDVGTSIDDLQWSAVLRSVSGLEMFRRRHGEITPQRVVGFLLLDRLFPRAIMHCIDTASRSLHAISGSPEGTFWNLAEKRMGQLRSDLAYTHVNEIITSGLHEFLDSIQTNLNDLGDAIYDSFVATHPEGSSGDDHAATIGRRVSTVEA